MTTRFYFITLFLSMEIETLARMLDTNKEEKNRGKSFREETFDIPVNTV